MTNDSGEKPREFWIKGAKVYFIEPCNVGKVIHVREVLPESPCPNCERLEEDTINAKRLMAHGVRQLEEIQKLQAQLSICKETLEFYASSNGDSSEDLEHFRGIVGSGVNVLGKRARECLDKLEKE